jgi:hypothetical protein
MALVIGPDVARIVRSATVPFDIGFDKRKEPPVTDSLHRTPRIRCVPSATTACSLFGTLTRGARTESRSWLAGLCMRQAFHWGGLTSTLRKLTNASYLAATFAEHSFNPFVRTQFFNELAAQARPT